MVRIRRGMRLSENPVWSNDLGIPPHVIDAALALGLRVGEIFGGNGQALSVDAQKTLSAWCKK